jgi:hypothetical protein
MTTSAPYLEGSVLRATCLDNFGKLILSEIDLNTFYGVSDGKFESSSDEGFKSDSEGYANKSQNARLLVLADGIWLQADLKKKDGTWAMAAKINLSICIENQNGQLKFVKQYVFLFTAHHKSQ